MEDTVCTCDLSGDVITEEQLFNAHITSNFGIADMYAYIRNAEGEAIEATQHPMMDFSFECETPLEDETILRKERAEVFARKITEQLKQLSMKSAIFSIGFSLSEKTSALPLNESRNAAWTALFNASTSLTAVKTVISASLS